LSPIYLDDELNIRDATAQDARSASAIEALLQHVGSADALILHREDAVPAVVLPWNSWRRVLLTIAAASGEDVAKWASH
jgi:hypothetical protein